jgi:type VI secretion system protein ImpM
MKVGFFGKLPSYGDFIQRNVTADLVNEWDNWLSQGLDKSKHQLQLRWASYYFASPIWRFCFKSSCNPQTVVTGLKMPSVDKAGRAYPFTLFCELQGPADIFTISSEIDSLHQKAELVLLALLESACPDLDDCVVGLQNIYRPFRPKPSPCTALNVNQHCVSELLRMESLSLDSHSCSSLHNMHYQFLSNYLTRHQTQISIWHFGATKTLKQHIRYYQNLPPAEAYSSLLLADKD